MVKTHDLQSGDDYACALFSFLEMLLLENLVCSPGVMFGGGLSATVLSGSSL